MAAPCVVAGSGCSLGDYGMAAPRVIAGSGCSSCSHECWLLLSGSQVSAPPAVVGGAAVTAAGAVVEPWAAAA